MARNTQLIELLDQLRSELRQSVNPSSGVNTEQTYKRALRTAQEFLYNDYDWSFLHTYVDVETEAGEQYYDFPVEQSSIQKVEFKWGNVWTPLKWGIGASQLNAQNSDDDQRSDPVTHIDVYQGNQFRVWPMPASDGNSVRFWGKLPLTRLVNNDDRALLDDLLIVSYAAHKLAPKERKKDALAELNTIYRQQKKIYRRPVKHFILGGCGGTPAGRQPPGHVRVAEANRSGS